MVTMFLRTVISYIILIIAMRLTGKRQIGELQITELVVTFMLSDLAVTPINNKDYPLVGSILPITVLLCLEVIFSFIQTKSPLLRKIFCGGPTILIFKGNLRAEELAKCRIDMEEFLGELRQKDIFDISDVEYAILEENGKLSVLPKASISPITPCDLNITVTERGTAHPIIIDGKINYTALSLASRTESWVNSVLKKEKLALDDIFLFSINDVGDAAIYIFSNRKTKKVKKTLYISFSEGKK